MKISKKTFKIPMPMTLDLDNEDVDDSIEVTIIDADEGMWLTQVEANDDNRTFGKNIFMPSDSPIEEWEEWTDEKKAEYDAKIYEVYLSSKKAEEEELEKRVLPKRNEEL